MNQVGQLVTGLPEMPRPLELLLGDAENLTPTSVLDIAWSVLDYARRTTTARPRHPPPPEPSHLRRAEEYILLNSAGAISIAALAAVARVSVSTLYASFRAHRGCSPMDRVREHRLQLARSKLLAAEQNVAQIAFACGFEHLGRFSARYRARFGESPSQTLRSARRDGNGSPAR
jgi:transcriptional regulator GlxA family with amidase domain